MATILRWFEVGGRRHRVYFRQTPAGSRELVIAGPGFQTGVGDVPVQTLEDLSEFDLTELMSRARAPVAVGDA
ncbi:MAG TPA: hypothetical protein VK929_17480 [Longimicrobiales bacterium]|nr:hypothetical protein [Longimicrobiales bacterium]